MLSALSAAYERWDGRGWPGALAGDEIPVAAQGAQAAEFIEVANCARRTWGMGHSTDLRRPRRGGAQACSSRFSSHMSTDTRVPGVSPGSIAAKTSLPACMSAAESKSCRTTAVP